MKKRVLLPIVAIMTALILAACGGNGPENTVDNFMKSYKDLKIEEASKYMTAELEEEYMESLEEESGDLTIEDVVEMKEFDEFKASFLNLTGELEYKVVEENVDGDTAEVKVDLTYADASEPITTSIGEIFGQLFGMAFTVGDMSKEEANAKAMEMVLDTVTKNLNDYEVKTEDTNGVIKLAKENEEWVITEFDDNVANALLFGVVEGMEDYNPFGFDDESIEEDIEFDFGDIEVNEDIDSTEVE